MFFRLTCFTKVWLLGSVIVFSSQVLANDACPNDGLNLTEQQRQYASNIEPRQGANVSAELLSIFIVNGCFGGELDSSAFNVAFRERINEAELLVNQHLVFKSTIQALLNSLALYATNEVSSANSLQTRQAWSALITQLNTLATTLNTKYADMSVDEDKLKTNVLSSYNGISLVSQNCDAAEVWTSQECVQSVTETAKLFRALVLAQKVVRVANLDNLQNQLTKLEHRLTGYKNYYLKAEPLWPWEHIGNSHIVTAKDVMIDGNLQGFREPAPYQLLFLHPTTALQFVNDQDTQFKPAVIVDVLGYNVLDWNDNSSDLKSYGASAIVSLSEFEGKTNVGWGLRFFYNKSYSFGLTKNSDQWGLFVSVGAVEKVNGWEAKKDEYLEEVFEQFLSKLDK